MTNYSYGKINSMQNRIRSIPIYYEEQLGSWISLNFRKVLTKSAIRNFQPEVIWRPFKDFP